jgi:peptidoglycan-N-acetylglucosamine deacetylase
MRAGRSAIAVAMVVLATGLGVMGSDQAGAVAGFRDVPPGTFYTAPVQWARNTGITTGVGGTDRFEPNRRVTRAEALAMLWRAHGRPVAAAERFADQPPGSFFDHATQWARATGITTGVGGTDRFEPHHSTSRAQLVTLLYRWQGSPPVQIDPNPPYQPDPVVYLTFDDGPDPRWTPMVLDLLDRHGAVATFFVVGRPARAWPDLLRQAVRSGHAVQNHTMTHPRLTSLSASGVAAELGDADRAVRDAIGMGTTCFRPPYGATNSQVASVGAGLGLEQVMWTIDTSDYKRPGAAAIANKVLGDLRPGANVLFHDGGGDRSQTVDALGMILPELARRGYQTALPCR